MNAVDDSPSVLQELDGAIQAVLASSGESTPTDLTVRLRRLVDEGQDAGYADEVYKRLASGFAGAPGPAARTLIFAWLTINDREYLPHDVAALDIRRVEFSGRSVTIDDLAIACDHVGEESLVPRLRDPTERHIITMGCELQVFVKEAEPHERALDDTHLAGSLKRLYRQRRIRRIAWGSGTCTLSDRRAVGIISFSHGDGVPATEERAAMPGVALEDDAGTVLVVTCERTAFEDSELAGLVFKNSLPKVNLFGGCSLALDPLRILDQDDRLVRPGKGVIADAVRTFVSPPSTS